jgi:hypothetical protein
VAATRTLGELVLLEAEAADDAEMAQKNASKSVNA